MTKTKSIINKIDEFRVELKDYLLKNIAKWEVIEVGEYTTTFSFKDISFQVWSANNLENRAFYGSVYGLDIGDIRYTEKECRKLQNKLDVAKLVNGTVRNISQTALGNDLFFKFDGVYGTVKFSGYNDSDWWEKYKPLEVKEDGDIIWEINWDKMTARYLSSLSKLYNETK